MEIERNVRIQVVGYEVREATAAGFFTGSHAATGLPPCTAEERESVLGSEAVERIRSAFKPLGRIEEPKINSGGPFSHRFPTA